METNRTYSIARNDNTGNYEVHSAGCKHSNLGHIEVMGGTHTADSGKAMKAQYEAANEGCLAKIAPCAR